ncbi:MAG: hypothetical protein Q9162_004586 [Coniocarpon cinnabarinum]
MSATPQDVYPEASNEYVRFASRRSVVHSTRGIVSASQPLAARAGVRILDKGGNAADAAVATAAALNMTEPGSTGIGGDCFCLFYNSRTRKTHALNGSGRSPLNFTLAELRKELKIPDGEDGSLPKRGAQSVTVPGAAAGWVDTIEKFGSGNLSMGEILAPAIYLGERGFAVHSLSSHGWQESEELIKGASPNAHEMLKPDLKAPGGCRAPRPGELFFNRNLAGVFRRLAEQGKPGFYSGKTADALVKVVQHLGGHMTHDDLLYHAVKGSEEVDAISLKFSGQGIQHPVELWEHPPNGQGLVALMALGILQELEKACKIPKFEPKHHNSTEYIHALVESLRLAFSDGTWYIADPAQNPSPLTTLTSPEYLAQRASAFSQDRCIANLEHGDVGPSPAQQSSDTVYFSVTDADGNACSFINSNYAGFGTAIVPPGCGFTLQNRGHNFVTGPANHPNVYAPGKRPYHTIIPAMVTYAETQELLACYGVMGGFMQPQGHVQTLLNMLVFGMDPQQALDAPRICVETPQKGSSSTATDVVYIEDEVTEEVIKSLREKGHNVQKVSGFARDKFGRGQIIRQSWDEGTRIWSAGSDLRGDGCAMPQ